MKFNQTIISVLIFISALSFGGCSPVGPDFKVPETTLPNEWKEASGISVNKQPLEENVKWWEIFNDPVLNSLVQRAVEGNLPLRTAALRIMESRARLGVAEGYMYPQAQELNGDIFTNRATGAAEDRSYYSASTGFDAAWEMDFWGKFRRSVESADAGLMASLADYDDVMISLIAEVARTYTSIRTIQERIRIADENSRIQENGLKLVMVQFQAGTVTELDVHQAKALLNTTLATIPNLRNAHEQNINAMAVLLGILPENLNDSIKKDGKIPEAPDEITAGIPADLLRRRPDIRKAEMLTAAQGAQVGVALADLYPSFSLFGTIGWSANDRGDGSLGDIFSSESFHYTFGPSFRWNLFHYGRIKNRVRIEDARLEQAITTYRNTVLNAAREVEDSVSGLAYAGKEAEYLRKSIEHSKKSLELSTLQYEEGYVDYQRVLDSTRAIIQKEDQYAQIQGGIATNVISLYKALGGGWGIRREKNLIPQDVKEEMKRRTDWGNLLTE